MNILNLTIVEEGEMGLIDATFSMIIGLLAWVVGLALLRYMGHFEVFLDQMICMAAAMVFLNAFMKNYIPGLYYYLDFITDGVYKLFDNYETKSKQ